MNDPVPIVGSWRELSWLGMNGGAPDMCGIADAIIHWRAQEARDKQDVTVASKGMP